MFSSSYAIVFLLIAWVMTIIQDCALRWYARSHLSNDFLYLLHPQKMGFAMVFLVTFTWDNIVLMAQGVYEFGIASLHGPFGPYPVEIDQNFIRQVIVPIVVMSVVFCVQVNGRKAFASLETPLLQDGVAPAN